MAHLSSKAQGLSARGVRPSGARRAACRPAAAVAPQTVSAGAASAAADAPLMLRALRGDAVERPPVWMMRQAGRYMKVYQDLCKKHTTFRERSENVDLAVEVSLQPWRAFKPDGVILFSDILTPLAGMNIPFDIVTVKQVTKLEAEESCPFVGESLRILRNEVGNGAAVLGFVGAPFTLATYIVEGGSSKSFAHTKRMAFAQPEVLHALLDKLADNVADYVRYQADAGAQVVQIFDSWASHLSPQDFDVFSGPYIRKVIEDVRRTHPALPIILYISGSGGLLERMAAANPDIISIDQSVDIVDGIKRVGTGFAIQGNMDPGVLFGSKDVIEARVMDTIRRAKSQGVRHIMNLGHGVLPGTPEENVAHFFEVARSAHQRM
ncbi:uroporphyrinogen-iii decarboxylase [Raphidocelis subcapitata]|uniref:Uroporphyrinogen decarboxylase n=1 Tax=Raphidocelis subcapitata TaxID=307507 RepID=A0A2V0P5Y7_9CHLO|nr:uroporphyrinogen-iii decarboxylase [Raphidocelis subcapitata]|eukprot:GBF94989.1 uroporphyrinogen-iii decarboxylase [Raphidocelis subcapitata]